MKNAKKILGTVGGALGLMGLLTTKDCPEEKGGEPGISTGTERGHEAPKQSPYRDLFEETDLTQRQLTARLKRCLEKDLSTSDGEWTVNCSQGSGFLNNTWMREEPFQADVLKCVAENADGEPMQTTQAYVGPITVDGEEFFTAYVGHGLLQGNKGPWLQSGEDWEDVGDLQALEERLGETCAHARRILQTQNTQLSEYAFLNEVIRDFLTEEGAKITETSVHTTLGFDGERTTTGFITGVMQEEGVQFDCVLTNIDLIGETRETLSCVNMYQFREEQEMPLVQSNRAFPATDILEDPEEIILTLTINPNLSDGQTELDYTDPIPEFQ